MSWDSKIAIKERVYYFLLGAIVFTIIIAMTLLLVSWFSVAPKLVTQKRLEQFAKPAAIPAETGTNIAILGNTLLARLPGRMAETNDHTFLFSNIREDLAAADLLLTNLDSPAANIGKAIKGKPGNSTLRSKPSSLFGLKYLGVNLVSVANYHSYDYGPTAQAESIKLLRLLDIGVVGGPKDRGLPVPGQFAAIKQELVYRNFVDAEQRFIFLAYNRPQYSNAPNIPTDAIGSQFTAIEDIIDSVGLVDKKAPSDNIIVVLYWGKSTGKEPSIQQIDLAHRLIDAGAKLILGYHPQYFQAVEQYNGGLIFYSLGNFIYDGKDAESYRSFWANVNFKDNKISKLQLFPIIINRETYQVQADSGAPAELALENLRLLSIAQNTRLRIKSRAYASLDLN